MECEICGRGPAKYMSFAGHQGFVIVRRVKTYSGVFCRDHAIEVAAVARGVSLKGMWFGSASLLLGTVRTLWDSLQLLDLPDEVKDSPWMLHKIGCLSCGKAHWDTVGEFACERCHTRQAIVSCEKCGTVHTCRINDQVSVESTEISSCRKCRSKTAAPNALRNWNRIVLARMVAEIASEVALADGTVDKRERKTYLDCMKEIFSFENKTMEFLGSYFDQCARGSKIGLLDYIENCTDEFRNFLVHLAVEIAKADGTLHPSELEVVVSIIKRLGLNIRDFFESADASSNSQKDKAEREGVSWWEILQVSEGSGPEEVKIAYYRLARQYHPDLVNHLPETEKQRALSKIKEINLAYEIAKEVTKNRQDYSNYSAGNDERQEGSVDNDKQQSSKYSTHSKTSEDTAQSTASSGSDYSRYSSRNTQSTAARDYSSPQSRTKPQASESRSYVGPKKRAQTDTKEGSGPVFVWLSLIVLISISLGLMISARREEFNKKVANADLSTRDANKKSPTESEKSQVGAKSIDFEYVGDRALTRDFVERLGQSNSKSRTSSRPNVVIVERQQKQLEQPSSRQSTKATPAKPDPFADTRYGQQVRTWFRGKSNQNSVTAALVQVKDGLIELSDGGVYRLNQLTNEDKLYLMRNCSAYEIGFEVIDPFGDYHERRWTDKSMKFSRTATIYAKSGDFIVLRSSHDKFYFVDRSDLSYLDQEYVAGVFFAARKEE